MEGHLAWHQAGTDTYAWTWFRTPPVLTDDDVSAMLAHGVPGVDPNHLAVELAGHPSVPHSWVDSLLFDEDGLGRYPLRVQEQVLTMLAGNSELPSDTIRSVWLTALSRRGWDLSHHFVANSSTPADVLADIARRTVQGQQWLLARDLDRITQLLRNPNVDPSTGRMLLSSVHHVLTGETDTEVGDVCGELPSVIRYHLIQLMRDAYANPDRAAWFTDQQRSWLLVAVASR